MEESSLEGSKANACRVSGRIVSVINNHVHIPVPECPACSPGR